MKLARLDEHRITRNQIKDGVTDLDLSLACNAIEGLLLGIVNVRIAGNSGGIGTGAQLYVFRTHRPGGDYVGDGTGVGGVENILGGFGFSYKFHNISSFTEVHLSCGRPACGLAPPYAGGSDPGHCGGCSRSVRRFCSAGTGSYSCADRGFVRFDPRSGWR